MLGILGAHGPELGVTADAVHLNTTADLTSEQLTQETAQLSILHQDIAGDVLTVVVQVSNATGHKFPTGVPIRRAWLHVRVTESGDGAIFESGAPLPDGRFTGESSGQAGTDYQPHYDVITNADQVQIYETVMHNSHGNVTHTFLNAAGYLKDNRLLPNGFDKGNAPADIAVYGNAAEDPSFLGGTDTVTYQVDVRAAQRPVQFEARLLYQSVGHQFIQDLGEDDTPYVGRFLDYYEAANKMPIEVAAIP